MKVPTDDDLILEITWIRRSEDEALFKRTDELRIHLDIDIEKRCHYKAGFRPCDEKQAIFLYKVAESARARRTITKAAKT